MTTALTTAPLDEQDPETQERLHVHAVYDQIASHFSSTRYKPWPIISAFLASLPAGSVGLDSGTGNGKYLPLPVERSSNIWTIGLDRSHSLLKIARHAGSGGNSNGATSSLPMTREVVWGDALGAGWRTGGFDYAISIATIHHFATPERRRVAIQRLLQAISPAHGRLLIYVWAVEQDALSKRVLPPSVDKGSLKGQDVFVPWVLSKRHDAREPVLNRYYHLFEAGELNRLACEAAQVLGLTVSARPSERHGMGVEVVREGWERSNWYIEIKRWSL